MTRHIEVLDPTASGPLERLPLAASLATLRDRILGIRVDHTWRSFTVFAGVVEAAARRQWGVRDVILFDPGSRSRSTDGERSRVADFVASVDVALVGLGT